MTISESVVCVCSFVLEGDLDEPEVAAAALDHLGVVRQVEDARREPDVVTLEMRRSPTAVPALVTLRQRLLDARADVEHIADAVGHVTADGPGNQALPETAAETRDRTRWTGGWPVPKVRTAKAVTWSRL